MGLSTANKFVASGIVLAIGVIAIVAVPSGRALLPRNDELTVAYPRTLNSLRSLGIYAPYDPASRRALFVLEVFDQQSFEPATESRDFSSDPEVDAEVRATNEDYAGKGYDRGHLAAAANYPGREELTFTLANTAPQDLALNRGRWARLEKKVRQLAMQPEVSQVWVVTGTLDEGPEKKTIGRHRLPVPSHFYKAVRVLLSSGEIHISAVVYPNEPPRSGRNYEVTTDELELRTGLNFWKDTPQLDESKVGNKWLLSRGWPE